VLPSAAQKPNKKLALFVYFCHIMTLQYNAASMANCSLESALILPTDKTTTTIQRIERLQSGDQTRSEQQLTVTIFTFSNVLLLALLVTRNVLSLRRHGTFCRLASRFRRVVEGPSSLAAAGSFRGYRRAIGSVSRKQAAHTKAQGLL
jgi:hypothetical protein